MSIQFYRVFSVQGVKPILVKVDFNMRVNLSKKNFLNFFFEEKCYIFGKLTNKRSTVSGYGDWPKYKYLFKKLKDLF